MCPQPVDIGGKAALQRPLRLKAEHASRLVDRERALRVEFGERTPADRDLRIGQQPAARSAASASRQYSKLETWRTVPAPPALPAWRQPRRRRR